MAGQLKMTNNVLSSNSGHILVSANAVGLGTSVVDSSDKLVVNGYDYIPNSYNS